MFGFIVFGLVVGALARFAITRFVKLVFAFPCVTRWRFWIFR